MSGDGRRVQRVEREVQQTIAQYLISGVKVRLPGLVTISKVMMPGDLRTAKVYVSVLGSEKDRDQVMETLQERAYQIQNYLNDQLRMRFCPKLTFLVDDTTEQVLKVEKIIQDLSIERTPEEERNLRIIEEEE